MEPLASNNYSWLIPTIQALRQGAFTDINHEELAQLLQGEVQAYVKEGVELTRSLIANLHLLPPDPTLHHQRKGHILRDRRRLKELLNDSPSLEAYLHRECTAELAQISWEQILDPDFFGEELNKSTLESHPGEGS